MKLNILQSRWKNIQSIWNNENHDDVGIEKVVRLFLATSNFLFPGVYLKQIYSGLSVRNQELSTDIFVVGKLVFPILVIYYQGYHNHYITYIVLWLMFETLNYVPTLIFASDLFHPSRSYRRSMLLLLINYFEIVFDFAAIYSTIQGLNKPFLHWFDPIYFSFSTSASLGMGDYYPTEFLSKLTVSFQSIIFIIYVVLFINVFSNKVEHKGYFSKSKTT